MVASLLLGLVLWSAVLVAVAPAQAAGETCEAKVGGVLVLINSSCANRARRDAIRTTWAKDLSELEVKFVVGTGCAPLDEDEVRHKAWDIYCLRVAAADLPRVVRFSSSQPLLLRAPVVDEYRNNVLKLMWALDNFSTSLDSYDYVVKLDDDAYVHLPSLLSSLACSPRTSHY